MSTSNNLRTRFRALFTRAAPEPETEEMPFDPEWEELLAWAQVSKPGAEQEGGNVNAEDREWAKLIQAARERNQPGDRPEDEAEWAAAIGRAKSTQDSATAPPRPARRQFDRRTWEERIERARQRATELKRAAQDGNRAADGASLRTRLERLVARAGAMTAAAPESEDAAPATASEEAQWQAAIQRAKTGHA
jgi:hypothetical protein